MRTCCSHQCLTVKRLRSALIDSIVLSGARRLTSDLAGLDDILQSAHRLLERRVLIRPVNLQQVDVFQVQLFQGPFDRVEDVFTGEALLIRIVATFTFLSGKLV
jgi:hypothetical protein